MSEKRKIGLVFGGRSVEHEVSVVSARGILAGFDGDRVDTVALAVTKDGRWLSPELSDRILRDDRDAVRVEAGEDDGARVVVDPGGGGLRVSGPDGTTRGVEVDAVFPIVHGWGGEDGRIQGVLELAGVPYVGAGVAGSAVAMDKELARRVLAQRGVPMADWRAVTADRWHRDPDGVVAEVADVLGFPVFVKPANGGSSVGIGKVAAVAALPAALEEAFAHDRKVVVERGIDAREIEVAVLGNERPEPSVPGEIVPGADFYTYEDKYRDGVAELRIPAPLEPGEAARIRDLAVEAFVGLDLEGMARVDFLVERGTGSVLFNEANTLPGFTPISMYPKLWEATGVPYAELLERLVDLAVQRFERDDSRRAR